MNKNLQKALTLSIVIPAYNEAVHLRKCLDAVASQTVAANEVIVVDNNSTDETVSIARSYDFVQVVSETKQGLTPARNRGFAEAKFDIIGRIDADSVIEKDWVERIKNDFADETVFGVTGLGETQVFMGLTQWYSRFWSRAYFWTVHSYFDINTMWGANMAIRRSIWDKIKNETSPDDTIAHEDQDLSFIMIGHGYKIIQDDDLLIKTSGGGYLYWPKFWEYYTRALATKRRHKELKTLQNAKKLRLGFWRTLPGAIAGWLLTVVFIVYSLLSWPIIKLILLFNEDLFKQKR